ncbi:OmpA family protein [Sinobacterium caligoides]|uniref:OmpA family protein n=1 Tax=Sinobacterium caligoides TaxID=933926 RepID=A0A3N2E0D2_9GAMM|nr:OmpA family protein [Sinobacterium caligoides]ROS05477.1 OmpA family protein [Sinobacterium caligoides]
MTLSRSVFALLLLQPGLLFADTASQNAVDTVSLKGGYSYAVFDKDKTNGGVAAVKDIEHNGFGGAASIVFRTEYSNFFKPYVDIAVLQQGDRRFVIPGIGLRHDFELEDSNFEPFYSLGVGYNYAKWRESPAPGIEKIDDTAESVTFTAQTGFDYYFTDNLAFDMTLRYDGYHVGTNVVENNRVTSIDDNGSLSVLAGLVYRFGSAPKAVEVVEPEQDLDHDGVFGSADRCPDTQDKVPVNEAGCPLHRFEIALHYQTAQFEVAQLMDGPSFDSVAFLTKHPDYHVRIIGHTDSVGSAAFNQRLSEQRAAKARDFLVEKGIAAERIDALGRGEDEPLASNDSAQGRFKNRRIAVEFYRLEEGQ